MYQLPVEKLDKIRKPRKRVKNILSDIGLESCKELLEELKCFDAGDDCFENTEWDDFTDSFHGKRRKKWDYRTETLSCALCWFSTRSWYAFRTHVQRCHEEEEDLTTLANCPSCSFVSHPDVVRHHIKLFHAPPKAQPSAASPAAPLAPPPTSDPQQPLFSLSTANVGDKYSCRSCGFHDSLIYVMRKHVLVNHCKRALTLYYGRRGPQEQKSATAGPAGTKSSQFYCRVCGMPAETSEHLLYHVLSSDKHREVHSQIRPLILQHSNAAATAGRNGNVSHQQSSMPPLAPRGLTKIVSLVNKSGHSVAAKGLSSSSSSGTMLLAPPSAPTALVCSAGGRVLLPPQTSGTTKNLFLAANAGISTTMKNVPISMLLNSPKQQPITVKVAQQQPMTVGVQQQQPTRQILLPPGVQLSVQNKMGVGGGNQPYMLTQRMPIPQAAPARPGPVLSTTHQSIRLVPTGNRVNGMPTYTLATVQMAVPVQTAAAGVSQVVNKAPGLVAAAQQHHPSQSPSSSAVPVLGNGMVLKQSPPGGPGSSSQTPTTAGGSSSQRPRELVVRTQFLRRFRNTVKCTRCQILLSSKGIFQHLLHGLRCMFCPLVFYSIRQVMDHCAQEHSLANRANRVRLHRDFIQTDEQGHLVFPSFDMTISVPQDLLGFKRLNLVVVTASKEKIYLQMSEEEGKPPRPALPKGGCPFCPERPRSDGEYEQHLKTRHHIVPTIHAILKTPAFKCVFCLGVYAEKSTTKTVSIHVQRCRCAPKAVKEAERLINPDPNTQAVNGGAPLPALDPVKVKESGGQDKSKRFAFDPSVPMVLDPTGMEMHSFEDRKLFLGRYFNRKPYLSRQETEALAGRLWFNRADVATLFGTKRKQCLNAVERRRAAVFLGFNMTELRKVQHNLLLPQVLELKHNLLLHELPEPGKDKELPVDRTLLPEAVTVKDEELPGVPGVPDLKHTPPLPEVPEPGKAINDGELAVDRTPLPKAQPGTDDKLTQTLLLSKAEPGTDDKLTQTLLLPKAEPGTDQELTQTLLIPKAEPGTDQELPADRTAEPGTDQELPADRTAEPGTDQELPADRTPAKGK